MVRVALSPTFRNPKNADLGDNSRSPRMEISTGIVMVERSECVVLRVTVAFHSPTGASSPSATCSFHDFPASGSVFAFASSLVWGVSVTLTDALSVVVGVTSIVGGPRTVTTFSATTPLSTTNVSDAGDTSQAHVKPRCLNQSSRP